MRFVLATARKDLLRIRRDWPALLLWIGIPLMVGALLVLMFGGEDAGPHGTLLVVDEDGSLAGRFVTGAFQQGALAEIVDVEPVDLEEGRERIEAGDASGLLVIPEGFGQAVLDGEPARLELVTNPAQTIVPGILEETLDIALEAAEVLRQLFDQPLDRIVAGSGADGFPADSAVASISTAFNRAAEDASAWLFPPPITIETVTTGDEESFDFARAFFPGMLILALLFMAAGLAADVWSERRQGTLRRAVSAPRGAGAILAGKWLAGAAALGVVAAVGLAAGRWLFSIEVALPVVAWAWMVLTGTALLALFTLVQLFARSEKTGNVLANALTLPLAMLGGSFFPFEAMPEWMVPIGQATPNGYALMRLRSILEGAVDPAVLALSAAVAVGVIVVLGWLAGRRLRGFATP